MSFVEKYFFGTPKMPRNLDISTFLEGGASLKRTTIVYLLVALLFPPLFSTWAEAKMVVTIADRLNVREGPGTTYRVKAKLRQGETYP